jgi:hypothetical protein
MERSWEPKPDTGSKKYDAVPFVVTVAIASGLAYLLAEWLLPTSSVGHSIQTSVTGVEDFFANIDLILIAVGSVMVFLIGLAFHTRDR